MTGRSIISPIHEVLPVSVASYLYHRAIINVGAKGNGSSMPKEARKYEGFHPGVQLYPKGYLPKSAYLSSHKFHQPCPYQRLHNNNYRSCYGSLLVTD